MADDRPVLLVEDHADTRQMMQECLEGEGIPVVVASNGLAALDALREHRPVLVLLDLNMPAMDGWQFLEVQASLERPLAAIPVIVLTGVPDDFVHRERLGNVR